MAKVINFTYKDKDYVLEFTREAVKRMEQEGFVPDNIYKTPMNSLPEFFAGAFKANHRHTRRPLIDEIFEVMTDKDALFERLADMYVETVESLVDSPDDESGNVKWDANW